MQGTVFVGRSAGAELAALMGRSAAVYRFSPLQEPQSTWGSFLMPAIRSYACNQAALTSSQRAEAQKLSLIRRSDN